MEKPFEKPTLVQFEDRSIYLIWRDEKGILQIKKV
jgi:hypothetical protein